MMKKNNLEAGFTLIELMIALAILGVVLAAVVGMFVTTGGYHTSQEQMVDVTQNVRAARLLMVDEIRLAGCNPKDKVRMGFLFDTADDSSNTDANSIHFTRDIDNGDGDQFFEPDGDAGDSNENVAYYRTNDLCPPGGPVGAVLAAGDATPGCLRRNTGGGGQPVAENIVDLEFRYYDADDCDLLDTTLPLPCNPSGNLNSFAKLDKIRTVEVIITGQVQSTARVNPANQTWTQQFRVRVRNL